MENDDRININTLINAHINGIHVDILKYPALYTVPRLESVSRTYARMKRAISTRSISNDLHQTNDTSSQQSLNPSNQRVE